MIRSFSVQMHSGLPLGNVPPGADFCTGWRVSANLSFQSRKIVRSSPRTSPSCVRMMLREPVACSSPAGTRARHFTYITREPVWSANAVREATLRTQLRRFPEETSLELSCGFGNFDEVKHLQPG